MKFLLALIVTSSASAWACQVQRLENIQLAISTRDEATVAYNAERALPDLPTFRATNCSQAAMANQFLMIAMGPNVVDYEDNVSGVNFNRDFGYKTCKLEGHPFANNNDHEARKQNFQEDWRFISSCLELTVEDEGNQPLNLPAKQPGCSVTRYSRHKMSFNGGFCYVKPNFASSYLLKLKVRPECQTRAHLEKLALKTQDLSGAINLYLAGDASGDNLSLRALSHHKFRTSINPIEELVKPSDDYGLTYPTFPEFYPMPDIHTGKLDLRRLGNGKVQLVHQLLVNNNCQRRCSGELCQSACDYAQPVIVENSIFDMSNGRKPELLTVWHDGGIAPARFQGLIHGIGFEVPEGYFQVGRSYALEAEIFDPKSDYERFKKRIQNRLNTIEQQLGRISSSSIPGIQEIPSIQNSRELPTVNTIPNVIFDRRLNDVERAVEQLRSYLSFKLWPPYYAGVCHNERCTTSQDKLLTLRVEFFVKAQSEDALEIEVLQVKRTAKIVPSYQLNNLPPLKISCE